MHILCLTFNAHGHVRPLLSLVDHLVDELAGDCEVSFLVPTPVKIDGPGLPQSAHPDKVKVENVYFPEDKVKLDLTNKLHIQTQAFEWLTENEELVADVVCEVIKDLPPVKIVMYDMFAAWALGAAKRLQAKPCALMCSPLSCMYLMYELNLDFHSLLPDDAELTLPDMVVLKNVDMPRMRMSHYVFHHNVQRISEADILLINDCPTLYPQKEGRIHLLDRLMEATKSLKVRPVMTGLVACKYFESGVNRSLPEISWLDGQQPRSVVYVALGSWCHLPPSDLCELAWGLYQTGRPFLWALRGRSEALETPMGAPEGFEWPVPAEPVDEESGLPSGFRELCGGRGLIVPWVSQTDVLKHPAVGVFVSHCGWNSISEAIALAGRPIVALPCDADQLINAVIIHNYLKNGIQLWRDFKWKRRLDRQTVAHTINHAFNDQTLIRNAHHIQTQTLQYFKNNKLSDIIHQ